MRGTSVAAQPGDDRYACFDEFEPLVAQQRVKRELWLERPRWDTRAFDMPEQESRRGS